MTPEEANAWIDKVEDLGSNLFAGRELTDEESLRLFDYYLSGEYLIKNLEIVREEKQKSLEGLDHLEVAEKRILDRIRKQQIHLKSNQS
ncbi:hypothetical protein WA1_07325 [Scytonema hofmannii PCC 7110]|uniref:PH domain-containing protein n=1 Tax=Scytonema hofmannii PCC 7110 TaxID=128403 RepID=A0A139WT75_9CYAN|nr:hypothetical protein [Scytonema hofmannii]KYC35620.1 hypothetical protein WA1_07325 [Scytonema hofmannii PCC 7110]